MHSKDEHSANIQAFRDYAKQGILAASAINSGALLAVLANSQSLLGHVSAAGAFRCWVAGLAVATLCWFSAYMANAGFTHGHPKREAFFTYFGLVMFLASIVLFCLGGWQISEVFTLSP